MQVTQNTTVDEFIQGTSWDLMGAPKDRLETVLRYFLNHVSLLTLNEPDHSSPWGPAMVAPDTMSPAQARFEHWNPSQATPKAGTGRTCLISWLQAISFHHPVDPHRQLTSGLFLKQFRFPGEPMTNQGNWYAELQTKLNEAALPEGQDDERIYRVAVPFSCLESTIADAYAGWGRTVGPWKLYRHGGATQLFIWRDRLDRDTLQLVGRRRSPY